MKQLHGSYLFGHILGEERGQSAFLREMARRGILDVPVVVASPKHQVLHAQIREEHVNGVQVKGIMEIIFGAVVDIRPKRHCFILEAHFISFLLAITKQFFVCEKTKTEIGRMRRVIIIKEGLP